jgi:hypothetical protein
MMRPALADGALASDWRCSQITTIRGNAYCDMTPASRNCGAKRTFIARQRLGKHSRDYECASNSRRNAVSMERQGRHSTVTIKAFLGYWWMIVEPENLLHICNSLLLFSTEILSVNIASCIAVAMQRLLQEKNTHAKVAVLLHYNNWNGVFYVFRTEML